MAQVSNYSFYFNYHNYGSDVPDSPEVESGVILHISEEERRRWGRFADGNKLGDSLFYATVERDPKDVNFRRWYGEDATIDKDKMSHSAIRMIHRTRDGVDLQIVAILVARVDVAGKYNFNDAEVMMINEETDNDLWHSGRVVHSNYLEVWSQVKDLLDGKEVTAARFIPGTETYRRFYLAHEKFREIKTLF